MKTGRMMTDLDQILILSRWVLQKKSKNQIKLGVRGKPRYYSFFILGGVLLSCCNCLIANAFSLEQEFLQLLLDGTLSWRWFFCENLCDHPICVWLSVWLSKLLCDRPNSSEAHHEKIDLKVVVIVIPKEGWAHMAAPILLLVWHRLFRIWLCWHHRLYNSRKFGIMPKEGFFWYDNDKTFKVCFLMTHVNCVMIHPVRVII